MAVNNTAGMSATLMKQYWHEKFLDELRSNLVLKDLGQVGTVPAGDGITVHWLSMADMSLHTTAATEGTDPTEYTMSGGDKTATLTPYNDAIKLSRHLAKTWIKGSMDQVLDKLARHAANKMDRVIRDINLQASGIAQYAGTATTRGTLGQSSVMTFDIAEAREARATLERANVAPLRDGFYVCVAHPDSLFDVEGDTNWRDVVKYDSRTFTNILKGETGEIHKIRFIKTTEAWNSAVGSWNIAQSASATVFQSYVLGDQCYGVSELEDVDIIVKDPAPASNVNGYSTAGYYFAFATRPLESSATIRVESVSSVNDYS